MLEVKWVLLGALKGALTFPEGGSTRSYTDGC
jgi:hypothetical protein